MNPGFPPPDFTADWFTHRVPEWERLLSPLAGRPIQCLEIGSHEGRSALWTLETICTHRDSRLCCIDVWKNPDVERRFDQNLAPYATKLTKLQGESWWQLPYLAPGFDFIYIDGSHEAADVLEDAVHCYRLAKPGGVICFDDYLWDNPKGDRYIPPKPAIDAFLQLYAQRLTVLHHGYQVFVQVTGPRPPLRLYPGDPDPAPPDAEAAAAA